MQKTIEQLVLDALAAAVADGDLALSATPEPSVERPRDPAHGDWATTIPLRLARELGRSPREIAEIIAARIAQSEQIAAVEVAGPGFINLRLSNAALQQLIRDAREQGEAFGRADVGQGQTINVEWISANPTGPMHVGHGRWAALGSALSNVLTHANWQVTREFYINDAGNQMDIFGLSVALRYLELFGRPIEMPDDCYGGSYIIDIARGIADEDGERWLDADENERLIHMRERGYRLMLDNMTDFLERIGVHFDTWFSERSLYCKDATTGASPLDETLATLDAGGYLYKEDGATWFRTTDFGDDKNRVLIKADGSYTYFAPDIAYHLNKFARGSECLIDIWGADHHGYIPRMMAACEALGHAGRLRVLLGQLVNLFRGGEVVRMSKRTGEMVTFEELVDEVGADATKYLMLARSTDQTIDFDIEVAKKQDASNPVYYVQYAHARICSLLRKAEEREPLALDTADLSLLVEAAELDLARVFGKMSEVVEGAARDLAPYRLTHYAEELATSFHSFYTRCQVIGDDRAKTCARLYLADATRSVLALVLKLLGVSAPERM
ncbi:MAG: arginine--tRNA ligase [Coriobacteriales bacterium]|jgi:arginyl-tRNA synthetase|nr:arginine--tRNA ligase [Coriobacteriales bacterium]